MSYDVLILSRHLSSLGQYVASFFNADCVQTEEAVKDKLAAKNYRVLVLDEVEGKRVDLTLCETLLKADFMQNMPLVALFCSGAVQDKVRALEIGCDDFIDCKTEPDEVCARITKSIFNQIASAQLSQRLTRAAETARSAMVDRSDLGANIQFLLQAHSCNNLDELGQQFFATIRRYGLSCSLQMRSRFETKNMEAHGMAKDLESQLLLQLKDRGRYVDFGRRSIINYDRVSLLIKNMPVDDPEKCGALKDSMFCLVQGVNARLLALEDRSKLMSEKESLRKLSADVNTVITSLKSSYQDVRCKIVTDVEQMAEKVQHRLPHLALPEADEQFLEDVTDGLLLSTHKTLSEGLKVNELFERLDKAVRRSLSSIAEPTELMSVPAGQGTGSSIELSD